MAPRLQIDPEKVLDSYNGLLLPEFEQNLMILGGPTPSIDKTISQLAEVMIDFWIFDSNTQLEGISCPNILMSLKARGTYSDYATDPLKEN